MQRRTTLSAALAVLAATSLAWGTAAHAQIGLHQTGGAGEDEIRRGGRDDDQIDLVGRVIAEVVELAPCGPFPDNQAAVAVA